VLEPVIVKGVPQRPIEGISMAYTFGDAKAPTRRTLQYFEMFGNRGIYRDGWTAVTKHRTPWETGHVDTISFKDDVWELYDTNKDFSQANNVAAKHPDKLAEMKALFLVEAAKYQVFPLDDRLFERANPAIAGRPDLMVGRKSMKLYNGMRLYEGGCAPNLKNTSFIVTADIDSPEGNADGVILAYGGGSIGMSFYLRGGKPKVYYNWFGTAYSVEAPKKLPKGRHAVRFQFKYDGGGLGKGGTMTISVDGEEVATGRIEKTVPFAFGLETVDVGLDWGRPVADDYTSTIFTGGSLNSVLVEIGEAEPVKSEHAEHTYHVAMARQWAANRSSQKPTVRVGFRSVHPATQDLVVGTCSSQTAAKAASSRTTPRTRVATFGQCGQSQMYSESCSSCPSGVVAPVLMVTRGIEAPVEFGELIV